jgi:hypothetical protein
VGLDSDSDHSDDLALPQVRFAGMTFEESAERLRDSSSPLMGAFLCAIFILNVPILLSRLGVSPCWWTVQLLLCHWADFFVIFLIALLANYYGAEGYVDQQEVLTASPTFLDFIGSGPRQVSHPLVLLAADAWVVVIELAVMMPDLLFRSERSG